MSDWVSFLGVVFLVGILDGGTGILVVPGIIFLVGYSLWYFVRAFQANKMSGTYTILIPAESGDPGYVVRATYTQGVNPKDSSVRFLEIRSDSGKVYVDPGETPDRLKIEWAVGEFFNQRRRSLKLPHRI